MQHAVHLVHAGHSADNHAYGDKGHIAAIGLLYDITVFTYSMQNKQCCAAEKKTSAGVNGKRSSPFPLATWVSMSVDDAEAADLL